MAQYEHLPIYKKAFDMTVYIENIVKGFSRYHKYTLGVEKGMSVVIIRETDRYIGKIKERLPVIKY